MNLSLTVRIVSDDDGQALDATIEAHGTPAGMGDLLATLLRGAAEVHSDGTDVGALDVLDARMRSDEPLMRGTDGGEG